ncbi:hypothetical protein GCM10009720_18080 [Yaniella flava]|uniref:ATP synthase protein I n=1 Tax=Yaniella flava TaxID=287930 RepID=A0ABP5G358_9MICC
MNSRLSELQQITPKQRLQVLTLILSAVLLNLVLIGIIDNWILRTVGSIVVGSVVGWVAGAIYTYVKRKRKT